jgi:hypothetical protein
MALDGADNPDMAQLRVGATRSEMDKLFGKPKQYSPTERRALYDYTTGEEGSPGRAIAHGVGDVLTLGLWEIVGTPVEAVQTHTWWSVDVWFSPEEKVVRWEGPRQQ